MIEIKTGDLPQNESTTAFIELHCRKNKSKRIFLENIGVEDFKAEQEYKYKYTSDKSENLDGTVEKIDLWRETGATPFLWFVECVTVSNSATKKGVVFPLMRLIETGKHYVIPHTDTSLPTDDPFKERRKEEIIHRQKLYQLTLKLDGQIPMLKKLPEAEHFSCQYECSIGCRLGEYAASNLQSVLKDSFHWKSFEDVRNTYISKVGMPMGDKYTNNDEIFGRQRLAGINSMMIKLCSHLPASFRSEVLPHTMGDLMDGKTIQEAIDKRKLFIVDYEILSGIDTKKGYVVPAPIALFYYNDKKKLMPVAIQLFQTDVDDNPVFLPSDPQYTWMLAKMWFNLADAHYHQSLSHLTFTHLIMEGVVVVSKRQLSHSHPIMRLLFPHFHYLLAINQLGLETLIDHNGMIDKLSNGGRIAAIELMKRRLHGPHAWRLDIDGTLPHDLAQRGITKNDLTNEYPARDDALLSYEAIHQYVREYVGHYYKQPESLRNDEEIQAWGKELVLAKTKGGIGLLGVPNRGKFAENDDLIRTLVPIIYTCSVGHAAVNFPQYDEYGAPLHYPYTLHGEPPRNKEALTEKDVLKALGDRYNIRKLQSVTAVLSEKDTRSLGYFKKGWIVDPAALKIVEKFRKNLQKADKEIEKRNKERVIPYEYLQPNHISNAISI